MAKFVKLTYEGDPVLVNLDLVTAIRPYGSGSLISFSDDEDGCVAETRESFEEIERLVAAN